ncbi:hypothetical protein [Pseudarthrobacter sp. BRE9]|uniref:hypothetical protein n=1 Tax=Pseudarthrobacter sp. BRE9 TaxID=2962582 RepID=UPI0028826293|nr:hypothetical protein [Pseudarthrobacter sp. BRE9]MDT0171010.1 hypothetical protein [Pseudarthrobacter sp. BRE9]
MAQPGQAGSQFPSEDAMIRRIKDLERAVQELRSANQLGPAGIRAVPDGIVVEGSMDVQGAETVSGTLNVTGNADFTGNVHIGGTLDLPAGIVNNDALSDPIVPGAYHADIQNISITSGPNVEKLRIDVPVPAGYTRALVNLTATMNMLNNSGATDSAFLGANINGISPGWSSNGTAASGAEVSLSNTVALLVEGLAGGTFPLTGKASSNSGTWAASGSSAVMNLNATVLFLR